MTAIVTPEDVGLSSAGLERVDAAVQTQIDRGVVAGAVTLVARHGHIVRTSVMGVDDLASGKPLALDSIFRIFSMTKPVTGLAMGILWDRGLWKPEDEIAKHLAEFADLVVFAGLDEAGAAKFEKPQHPPTMAELMTHTAGFSYGMDATNHVDGLYAAKGVLRSTSLGDFVAKLAELPLAYQPGSTWRYSVSMDIQGAIIERLSGQTLADFMEEHIFAPLGMVDTAFFTPAHKLPRPATLYFSDGTSELRETDNPLFDDATSPPGFPMGGAGLVSTAADYAAFAQLVLDGGETAGARIASAEAIALQTTDHLPEAIIEQRIVAGHMRFRPGFGYGWNGVVVDDPVLADLPVGVGTYFWDGAAGTWFWIDPANDLLYIGMIQLLSYSAPPLQETTQRLMAGAILRPGKARG